MTAARNTPVIERYPGNPILTRVSHVRRIATSLTGALPLLGGYQLDADYRWGDVTDDASDDPASLKYRTDNTTRAVTGGATARVFVVSQ